MNFLIIVFPSLKEFKKLTVRREKPKIYAPGRISNLFCHRLARIQIISPQHNLLLLIHNTFRHQDVETSSAGRINGVGIGSKTRQHRCRQSTAHRSACRRFDRSGVCRSQRRGAVEGCHAQTCSAPGGRRRRRWSPGEKRRQTHFCKKEVGRLLLAAAPRRCGADVDPRRQQGGNETIPLASARLEVGQWATEHLAGGEGRFRQSRSGTAWTPISSSRAGWGRRCRQARGGNRGQFGCCDFVGFRGMAVDRELELFPRVSTGKNWRRPVQGRGGEDEAPGGDRSRASRAAGSCSEWLSGIMA